MSTPFVTFAERRVELHWIPNGNAVLVVTEPDGVLVSDWIRDAILHEFALQDFCRRLGTPLADLRPNASVPNVCPGAS